mgnify:CR=1 FL=1
MLELDGRVSQLGLLGHAPLTTEQPGKGDESRVLDMAVLQHRDAVPAPTHVVRGE